MIYQSERITNISELEAILGKISTLAQLLKNNPCIEKTQGLTDEIIRLSESARGFQFNLEVRRVNDPTR